MPEDLKLSQIGSSQLPPPLRGLHSPGVRKHCQIIFACYFRKSSIGATSDACVPVLLGGGRCTAWRWPPDVDTPLTATARWGPPPRPHATRAHALPPQKTHSHMPGTSSLSTHTYTQIQGSVVTRWNPRRTPRPRSLACGSGVLTVRPRK